MTDTLTEDQAILEWNNFQATKDDPEASAPYRAKLVPYLNYRKQAGLPLFPTYRKQLDDMRDEEAMKSQNAIESLYVDGVDKYVAGLEPEKQTAFQSAVGHADPEEAKAAAQEIAMLAWATRLPADKVGEMPEAYRPAVAKHYGIDPGSSREQLAARVKQDFQARRDEKTLVLPSLGEAAIKAAYDGRDAGSAWAEWKFATLDTPGFNVKRDGDYKKALLGTVDAMNRRLDPYRTVIAETLDGLNRWTGKKDGEDLDFSALADKWAEIPRDDRSLLYAAIAHAAQKEGGEVKGFWKQMGESFGRGVGDLAEAGTFASRALSAGAESLIGTADALRSASAGDSGLQGPPAPVQVGDTVIPQPADVLKQPFQKAAERADVQGELRALALDQIDPIKPALSWMNQTLERGLYGAARSVPNMAAAALGGVGLAANTLSYAESAYGKLRKDYPEMERDQALAVAAGSGLVQSSLERVGVEFMMGRLGINKAISEAMMKVPFAGRFAVNAGLNVVVENLEEASQDITTASIQDIASALDSKLPGPNWTKELQEFADTRLETFVAVLPLAIIFGGGHAYAQGKELERIASNADAMRLAGFHEDLISQVVAAGTPQERVDLIRHGWETRTKDPVELKARVDEYQKKADSFQSGKAAFRQAQATADDFATAGIGIRRDEQPDGSTVWKVRDTETNVTTEHPDYDSAWQMASHHMTENLISRSEPFMDALQQYMQAMPAGREMVVTNESGTLADQLAKATEDGDAKGLNDIWARAQIERSRRGESPLVEDASHPESVAALDTMTVLGKSYTDFQEKVGRSVATVYRHGNVIDLVEEMAESDMKEHVGGDAARLAGMEAAIAHVESVTGDKYQHGTGKQAVTEAWSALVRLYTTGTRKQVGNAITKGARAGIIEDARMRYRALKAAEASGASPELFARLREYFELFKATMARVARLMKAKAEGKLDADVESMIRKSIGLDEMHQHVQEVEQIAQEEAAPVGLVLGEFGGVFDPAEAEHGFSLGRVEQLTARTLDGRILHDKSARNSPSSILSALGLGKEGGAADPEQRRKHGRQLARASELARWAEGEGRSYPEEAASAAAERRIGSGGEHLVYLDEATQRVLKRTKAGLFGAQGNDVGEYLQRWALHNEVFGDDVRIEGVTKLEGDDEIRVIVSQPFFEGRDATAEELSEYLASKGFVPWENWGAWVHPARGVAVWDTQTPGNALMTAEGVRAIDLQIAPAANNVLKQVQGETGMGKETSFSLAPTAHMELLARSAASHVADPSARLEIWAKVHDQLQGMARAIAHNDKVDGMVSAHEIERERIKRKREALAVAFAEIDKAFPNLTESEYLSTIANNPFLSEFFRFEKGKPPRGRMRSRATAERHGDVKGDYDGSDAVPWYFFLGSEKPDSVLTGLQQEGLMGPDTNVSEMFERITKELASVSKHKDRLSKYAQDRFEARQRITEETNAWAEQERAALPTRAPERAAKDQRRFMAALDYILMQFPVEVRDKVGGYVQLSDLDTNAQRTGFILKRIDRLDKVLEAFMRKETRAEIDRIFDKSKPTVGPNKVPKGKLTPETQALIDRAESLVNLTAAERDVQLAEAEGSMNNAQTDDEMAAAAERYLITDTFANMESMTANQMEVARKWLVETYSRGRTGNSVLNEATKAYWNLARAAVIDANGAADPGDADRRKTRDSKPTRIVVTGASDFIDGLSDLHQQLTDVLGLNHPLTKDLSTRIRHAREQARMEQHNEQVKLYNWIKTKLGIKSEGKQSIMLGKLSQRVESPVTQMVGRQVEDDEISIDLARKLVAREVDDVRYPWTSPQFEELTAKLEAYDKAQEAAKAKGDPPPRHKYLQVQRVVHPGTPKLRHMSQLDAIQDTLLWRQERYRENNLERHGLGEAYQNAVEAWLTPEAKVIRDYLTEQYGGEYDGMNHAFRELFNMDMPRESNYARASFDTPGMQQEAMGPDGQPNTGAGTSLGSIKSRIKHNAAPKLENALALRMSHVAQISHWKAAAAVARDLRAIFSPINVRDAIITRHGAVTYDRLMKAIQTFEGQGSRDAMANLDASKLLEKLMGLGVANALFGNISSLLVQMPAAIIGATRIGPVAWGKAAAKVAAKLIVDRSLWRQVRNDDALVLRRGSVYSRGQLLTALTGDHASRTAKVAERTGEFFGELLGLTDAFFTTLSGSVLYQAHLDAAKEMGLKGKEAEDMAFDRMRETIEQTAQPDDFTRKSNFENALASKRGAIALAAKSAFMFKSAARSLSSNTFETIRLSYRGEITKTQAGGLLLSQMVLIPVIEQAIRSMFRDMASDDPDDKIWYDWKTWAAAILTGPLNGMPLIGNLQDIGKAVLLGKHSVTNPDPATALFGEIARNWRHKSEEGELDIKQVEVAAHITSLALTLIGVPGGQLVEAMANLSKAGFGIADNLESTDEEKDSKQAKKDAAKERRDAKAAGK